VRGPILTPGPSGPALLRLLTAALALLGPREMSDLSPQSGPKGTLIRSLLPIAGAIPQHESTLEHPPLIYFRHVAPRLYRALPAFAR